MYAIIINVVFLHNAALYFTPPYKHPKCRPIGHIILVYTYNYYIVIIRTIHVPWSHIYRRYRHTCINCEYLYNCRVIIRRNYNFVFQYNYVLGIVHARYAIIFVFLFVPIQICVVTHLLHLLQHCTDYYIGSLIHKTVYYFSILHPSSLNTECICIYYLNVWLECGHHSIKHTDIYISASQHYVLCYRNSFSIYVNVCVISKDISITMIFVFTTNLLITFEIGICMLNNYTYFEIRYRLLPKCTCHNGSGKFMCVPIKTCVSYELRQPTDGVHNKTICLIESPVNLILRDITGRSIHTYLSSVIIIYCFFIQSYKHLGDVITKRLYYLIITSRMKDFIFHYISLHLHVYLIIAQLSYFVYRHILCMRVYDCNPLTTNSYHWKCLRMKSSTITTVYPVHDITYLIIYHI